MKRFAKLARSTRLAESAGVERFVVQRCGWPSGLSQRYPIRRRRSRSRCPSRPNILMIAVDDLRPNLRLLRRSTCADAADGRTGSDAACDSKTRIAKWPYAIRPARV